MKKNTRAFQLIKKYERKLTKNRYRLNAAKRVNPAKKFENEKKLKNIRNLIKKYFYKEAKKYRKKLSTTQNAGKRNELLPLERVNIVSPINQIVVTRSIYQSDTGILSEIVESNSESENEIEVVAESEYFPDSDSNSDSTIATFFNMELRYQWRRMENTNPPIIIISSDEEN